LGSTSTAMMSFILIFCFGFVIGIFSGLLGIGGGLLLIPTMLYLYPLFASPLFSLKQITGIAVTQSLAGSLSSSWVHYSHQNMHLPLVLRLGIGSMVGSYLGGYTSQYYEDVWIKALLLGILALMLALSLRSPKPQSTDTSQSTDPALQVNPRFWVIAMAIGYVSGILGIGGAAFMVPILYGVMRVPVRLAIGSGAGVVVLTSIMAFLGKAQAGQIPLPEAFVITGGAILGAILGAKLSQKAPIGFLKGLMFSIILLSFIRLLVELVAS
jgi:uncharacterized protein